jgi:ribosome biogenesis protein YTM1
VEEGEGTETEAKAKIGVEEIIEIEYIESFPPPKPEDALMHDDWVSAIDVSGKW